MRSSAAQNFSHYRTKAERSGIWGRQRWSTHADASSAHMPQLAFCHSGVACASLTFMSQKPQAQPWPSAVTHITHMTEKAKRWSLKCSRSIVAFVLLNWFVFQNNSIQRTCENMYFSHSQFFCFFFFYFILRQAVNVFWTIWTIATVTHVWKILQADCGQDSFPLQTTELHGYF